MFWGGVVNTCELRREVKLAPSGLLICSDCLELDEPGAPFVRWRVSQVLRELPQMSFEVTNKVLAQSPRLVNGLPHDLRLLGILDHSEMPVHVGNEDDDLLAHVIITRAFPAIARCGEHYDARARIHLDVRHHAVIARLAQEFTKAERS